MFGNKTASDFDLRLVRFPTVCNFVHKNNLLSRIVARFVSNANSELICHLKNKIVIHQRKGLKRRGRGCSFGRSSRRVRAIKRIKKRIASAARTEAIDCAAQFAFG